MRHGGCHGSNPRTLQKVHCPNGLIAPPRGNRQGHQFIIHHLGIERFSSSSHGTHYGTTATYQYPPKPYMNQTISATSYLEVVVGERRQSPVICQFSEHRQRTNLTHISRVGLCWSQPHLVQKVSVWSPCLLKLIWKWPTQVAHLKQENIGNLIEHPETLRTSTISLQTLLPNSRILAVEPPLCQGALSYATNSSKWIKCVATFLSHAWPCHEAGPELDTPSPSPWSISFGIATFQTNFARRGKQPNLWN